MTRSGTDKGALSSADILRQRLHQPLLPGTSAEAALHLRLYADHSDIGAVLHVHSLSASVVGRLFERDGNVVLTGWELQKALPGVQSHESRVHLPVFANTQDIATLAADVAQHALQRPPDGLWAPGYVIAGHGLYAWGRDAKQAWKHLEALEVLLAQQLALHNAQHRAAPTAS